MNIPREKFEMEINILLGAQFRISSIENAVIKCDKEDNLKKSRRGKKSSGNKSPWVKKASGNPQRALKSFLHLELALHHFTLISLCTWCDLYVL